MTQQEKEEFKTTARKVERGLLIIFSVLLLLFLFKNCQGGEAPAVATVKVAEVKGSFKPVKPIITPIVQELSTETKYRTYALKNTDKQLIDSLLKANKKLSEIYNSQNDSIKKGLYEKAIQLNAFNQKFEDSLTKIDIYGVSRGTVESLGVDYILKERKIQVPQKKVKFRLLGGVSVANDTYLQKPLFGANIGFQNKRGNVLRFGYDSEKRISVGYDISIFKIEK